MGSAEKTRVYESPFDARLGLQVLEASPERVVATLPVRSDHHQPGGIVHGGVYTTVVESVGSIGAHLWLQTVADGAGGGYVVGVTNHTDFVRAVRDGLLRAEATPVQRGRTLQLWRVEITDEAGRIAAHGTLKLMNIRDRDRGPHRPA